MTDRRPQPSEEHLALLYRLSQTFNSSLDLGAVLNQVIDEVIAATRAERGFVMLAEPEGKLVFRAARGIDQQTIEEPGFQVSRGVIERVASRGQPMLTSDAQIDERISMLTSVMSLGLRSVLCVPLKVKENTIGVIYVDNRLKAGIFSQADLDLMNAIAANAAVAIENARLYQVAVEKGRMERELQVAHKVQASLLPAQTPQLPGWEFAAHWQPAREVSGDYYDFIEGPEESLGLTIADVTDKGMPAALFMAFTRSIVRASLDHVQKPEEGLTRANHLICSESSYGFFVTLVYALVYPNYGDISYVNAGHNPPLKYDSRRSQLEALARTGIPLGIEQDWTFEQAQVSLDHGDFILFYTDGLVDAIDANGDRFGMERLQQVLLDQGNSPAGEIIVAIEKALSSFVGETIQYDDITLLVAKRQ